MVRSRLVSLSDDVVERVIAHATKIERENAKKRRKNMQGFVNAKGLSLERRILGYMGEAAFAEFMGFTWSTSDDWKRVADVGTRWEVRTTDHQRGRLIVTPRDHIERDYVLVIARSGVGSHIVGPTVLEIMGWYNGHDAQKKEWWEEWRTQGGAFYVPQEVLRFDFSPSTAATARERERALAFEQSINARPLSDAEREQYSDWRSVLKREGVDPTQE